MTENPIPLSAKIILIPLKLTVGEANKIPL